MKNKKQAAEIVALLEQEYPIAECFLDNEGAWQLLVAVRLSAQCTDLRVNATTPILFGRFPTIDTLADADVKEITEIDVRWSSDNNAVCVELWKYDPALFAVKGEVDPVSLAMSLSESEDERVQGELEEYLEGYEW